MRCKQCGFAFKITGKLLSLFHINNPDAFPLLKECPLKKHIALKMAVGDFNSIIKNISLYAAIFDGGDPTKYMLVIRAPKDHADFTIVESEWGGSFKNKFYSNFPDEIYKNSPSDEWDKEWDIMVVSLDELISTVVLEKYKWKLYP